MDLHRHGPARPPDRRAACEPRLRGEATVPGRSAVRRSSTCGRAVAALVVVLLLAGLWVLSGQGSDWFADARDPGASSSSSTDPESGLPRIDEDDLPEEEIGRASCRERVCQYV